MQDVIIESCQTGITITGGVSLMSLSQIILGFWGYKVLGVMMQANTVTGWRTHEQRPTGRLVNHHGLAHCQYPGWN
jgi:hypothetical protein